jgi:YHS domain-containing protein
MILKWIIAIIVIYLLYRLIRKSFAAVGEKSGLTRSPDPAVGEELVEDPLCHTYVPLSQAYQKEIGGKTVYFCSRECLERYGKK